MKKFVAILISTLVFSMPVTGSENKLKDDIRKILKNNPSIIIDVINENPGIFIEAIQNASKKAQALNAAQRENEEKRKLDAAFANPLKPVIRKDEAIRGTRNAPITIVEYSDFQCPYCVKGNQTVQALMKKYKGKIQFIYKHLPLSFHREAKITARYYEAIRMQSNKLAFKFHDSVFADIKKLRDGEKALKSIAKKAGVNMKKLEQTLKNKIDVINARIQEDMNEASKFDFQGTPGFLVNGIPVKGAYPLEHFVGIIEQLQKRKLITL
ncbi:MAG: thioredoxin domain-containing protein [Gammaproteobacteria bacterium]|nr:thioredoxin domain-containing protein [Gammaproteobacteria bacterium]